MTGQRTKKKRKAGTRTHEMSYIAKVDWIQRWADQCGERNQCERYPCPFGNPQGCQRAADLIINGCYTDHRKGMVV